MQQFHYIIIELGSSAISDICEKGHQHCVCGNQLSVILHLHRMYENVPPKNFSSHTVH